MNCRGCSQTIVVISAVVCVALLAAGCAAPDRRDRRSPDLSRRHTRVETVGIDDVGQIESVSLSAGGLDGDPVAILIGDVAGGGADELVIVRSDGFAVYSFDGRLRAVVPVRDGLMSAGVLVDHDGDGKLDVVTGTERGTDPAVNVHNGRGLQIGSYRLFEGASTFAALRPSGFMDGDLLVLATENWLAGARGVFRLHVPSLDVRWFSAIPTAVIGVAVSDRTALVSNDIQGNGEFTRIGTGSEVRFGFDAHPQILVLSRDGSPTLEKSLPVAEGLEHSPVWLVPAGEDGFLVHEDEPDRLSLARMSDGLTTRTHLLDVEPTEEVAQIAVHDLGFAVVTRTRAGWTVRPWERYIAGPRHWEGPGGAPRVVAAVAGPDGRTGYLAVRAHEIMLMDDEGVRTVAAGEPDDEPVLAVASASDGGVTIVSVGARTTLLRLPLVVPADDQ